LQEKIIQAKRVILYLSAKFLSFLHVEGLLCPFDK